MAYSKILLFGGSFDPVHNGHLAIARAATNLLAVDKTILIPAAQPPHKLNQTRAPIQHRLEMLRLATADDDCLEVSDCEADRPGPGYTIDTVRHFRGIFGSVALLYWLVGGDSIKDLPTWKDIVQLADECILVTAPRPDCPIDWPALQGVLSEEQILLMKIYVLDTPQIDISATDLRRRIAQNLPIDHLTPPAVTDYIHTHDLYRS
ncbi:MAG: nicotinate (nicotinamide) nucleotide adenylyltransferase [Sedimentisphaerales bacterium]|nr:nicotinate (nicotinamide) nucleotide adenylyltransferase [Sedimentisphaerales bacterium]